MQFLTAAIALGGAIIGTEATPLAKRNVVDFIPASANEIENKFQPFLDFDKDGCYYTSAIDSAGNLNPGLGAPIAKSPEADCRGPNRLEKNNLYSRKRCNNGWCAIM
jgi:hypothetical protein